MLKKEWINEKEKDKLSGKFCARHSCAKNFELLSSVYPWPTTQQTTVPNSLEYI